MLVIFFQESVPGLQLLPTLLIVRCIISFRFLVKKRQINETGQGEGKHCKNKQPRTTAALLQLQSRGQVKKKGYEKRQLPYVPFTPEPSLSKRVLQLNCYNCPVMFTFKMEDPW